MPLALHRREMNADILNNLLSSDQSTNTNARVYSALVYHDPITSEMKLLNEIGNAFVEGTLSGSTGDYSIEFAPGTTFSNYVVFSTGKLQGIYENTYAHGFASDSFVLSMFDEQDAPITATARVLLINKES